MEFALDKSKLCICLRDIGISGLEALKLLRDECKIQMELGDAYNILAVISLGDKPGDIDALVKSLKYIKQKYQREEIINYKFKFKEKQ